MIQENVSYLDYRIKDIRVLGAKKAELEVDNLIVDKHGTMGIVRHIDERNGAFIEYIDGSTSYEKKEMKIRKMSQSNEALFRYNQRYYGYITRLAKIIMESISDDFPNVNMFNNGNVIFVRGSTLRNYVTKFTHAKITSSHSLFSVKLTPFFNCEIEDFDIKKSKQKSNYGYLLLRNLFIDIDLDLVQAQKTKFTILDSNPYNKHNWERIVKQFRKFHIKYVG